MQDFGWEKEDMKSGTWHELKVGGHPCDVFEPAVRHPQGFVVLYLHGVHLNRLVDKGPFIEQFAKHGLTVVAPFTQRSWWTDIICQEFDPQLTAQQHLLQNVVPWLEERYGAAVGRMNPPRPPKLALLGTSMRGQAALRLSYKFPTQFPVAAAISPAIDYYLRYNEGDETIPQMYPDPEAARQDTALLHIHPLNWPRYQFFCCDPEDFRWWNSADRLRMKLSSLGIPHECDLETTGGGHSFDYYNRMAPRAIQFLVDKLEAEQRRIM